MVVITERRQPASGMPAAIAPPRVPLPILGVLAAAAAKLLLHLVTNGQYGYNTDELYHLVSGRHLAFGYVDYPPITPLLARLGSAHLGDSPWALRLLPSLVGAGLVLGADLIGERAPHQD